MSPTSQQHMSFQPKQQQPPPIPTAPVPQQQPQKPQFNSPPQPVLFKSGSNGNLLNSSSSQQQQPYYNLSSGGSNASSNGNNNNNKSNMPVYLSYLNHAKSVANLANSNMSGHQQQQQHHSSTPFNEVLNGKNVPIKTLNMHKSNENLFDATKYAQQQRYSPPKSVNNGTYTKGTTHHFNYQAFDSALDKIASGNNTNNCNSNNGNGFNGNASKKQLVQGDHFFVIIDIIFLINKYFFRFFKFFLKF